MKVNKSESSPYLIPGAIIMAGLLIAGAVMYSNGNAGNTRGNNVRQGEVAAVGGIQAREAVTGDITDDDPAIGNPDAPVTIVEFSDFQCPYCGQFFKTTEPQIFEKYVKTGKVRFVYRDFPLSSIHPMAQKAAEAAECAHEQDKFWQYHDHIFENQSKLSEENFKKWAGELGLNTAQFAACLDSGKYADEVEKDLNDGIQLGVTGTPTNFVNGKLVVGAVPFSQFESLIEAALKGK